MNIFKKIISLFKRKKKDEPVVSSEPATTEEQKEEKEIEELSEEIKEELETPAPVEEVIEVQEEKEHDVCLPISDEIKNLIADMLRPVVKSYNNELKEQYAKYVPEGEEVKTLKTYSSIVDGDTLLIFKFTQSDAYNKKIEKFVAENLLEVVDYRKLPDSFEYMIEAEEGKIKIRIF